MIAPRIIRLLALLQICTTTTTTTAFSVGSSFQGRRRSITTRSSCPRQHHQQQDSTTTWSPTLPFYRTTITILALSAAAGGSDTNDTPPTLKRVSPDLEGIPVPFVDVTGNAFIECYADTVANVDGVQYTIGVPCDYAVALCAYDDNSEDLVPIELDDDLMDDVFPMAEEIVAEEFGEELVLQRTPQTLTLVGELEEDDEEDFEEDDDIDDDDEDDEEEVEVLLSFDHRGKEISLVRLLDPILLVGRIDDDMPENRLLLSPDESEAVMPILEQLFLEFHDDPDAIVP